MSLKTCLNGISFSQMERSDTEKELVRLARIQTGHLATNWVLKTTRVTDVGWGWRGRLTGIPPCCWL